MSTFVIAECGSAHEGDLPRAFALIETAKECGAEAAKFQFWSSAQRLAARRHAPELAETYAKFSVPSEWLPQLQERCDALGIEFMCTAYLPEDIGIVAPHVKRFKIASFESMDNAFIKAHVPHEKDLVISCGLLEDAQMERLLSYRRSATIPAIRLLQCTSAYPANVMELNLAVIGRYAMDGFSDHSAPEFTWTGALAVAAGASIVEAHFRQENTPKTNPDYPHSMNPRAFKEYVKHIRFAETCAGDGTKGVALGEVASQKYRV